MLNISFSLIFFPDWLAFQNEILKFFLYNFFSNNRKTIFTQRHQMQCGLLKNLWTEENIDLWLGVVSENWKFSMKIIPKVLGSLKENKT